MRIGLVLPQAAEDGGGGTWSGILGLARQAEDGGADSLWLSDHFFYRAADAPIGSETGYHEAWTLLSALAATTRRVELGTLVLATSFRPAGLLAKMAATVDDVSGGRVILGLGCGWHEPEYEAFGYPFDHRVGRFEEALRIIVPLVHGERVTFDGAYGQVHDAADPPDADPARTCRSSSQRRGADASPHCPPCRRMADGLVRPAGRPVPRSGTMRSSPPARPRAAIRRRSTSPSGLTFRTRARSRPSAIEAGAVAEALLAWQEAGANHVQLAVNPGTHGLLCNRPRGAPGIPRLIGGQPFEGALGVRRLDLEPFGRATRSVSTASASRFWVSWICLKTLPIPGRISSRCSAAAS